MEGTLQGHHRCHDAEVVLAALDDRQRRWHALDAFRGLARHHVLWPLDDLHVHVRLLEPQPLRHLIADPLQPLFLLFGQVEHPLAAFDVRWELFLAAALLLLAGLAPRRQTPQRFPFRRLVRHGLGLDDRFLLRAWRFAGAIREVQRQLVGRFSATLAVAAPEHIHQTVVGGFQFGDPPPLRVAFVGDDPRGVRQCLVVAADRAELRGHVLQGGTQ